MIENGKILVSQKKKADGVGIPYRDVSNFIFEKHERGMKKAVNSGLRSELVDPEVFPAHTIDEVIVALHNINLTNAAGPDKNHPRFLLHMGPVFISLMTSVFNKSFY